MIMALIICCQTCSAFYICTSCSDCNDKINAASDGSTVYLTNHISSNGTCIRIHSKSGITFDCQDYSITGSLALYSAGVDIGSQSVNNTFKNCAISGFYYGFQSGFSSSNRNRFENNILSDLTFGIDIENFDYPLIFV